MVGKWVYPQRPICETTRRHTPEDHTLNIREPQTSYIFKITLPKKIFELNRCQVNGQFIFSLQSAEVKNGTLPHVPS
jgi:hypothetical protein